MSNPEFPIGDERVRLYHPGQITDHLPENWRESIVDVFRENRVLQITETQSHYTSREAGLTEPLAEWAVNGEVLAEDSRTAWIDELYKGMFYELALEADPTAKVIDEPKLSTRAIGHRPGQRGEAHVDYSPVAINLYVDLPRIRNLKYVEQTPIERYLGIRPTQEMLGGHLAVTTEEKAQSPEEILETGQMIPLEIGSVTVLKGNQVPHFALGCLSPQGWVCLGRGAMRLMVGFNYLNANVTTFDDDLLKYAGILET